MNKSDLITALSAKENLTETDASRIINHVFDDFTAAPKMVAGLKSGDSGVSP